MTRLLLPLAFLAVSLTDDFAKANPWVLQSGEIKITASHNESHLAYQQSLFTDPPRYVARKARKTDAQIYLEYGLNDQLTLIEKTLTSDYVEDGRRSTTKLVELGSRIDAPILGTGLLPPYFYALIDYFVDDTSLYRETPASAELWAGGSETTFYGASQTEAGRSASADEYGIALSLGDKILLRDNSVTQQVRYGWGGDGLSEWRIWEYKFELGLKNRLFFGTKATAYQNHITDYATLAHYHFIEWRIPRPPVSLRYASGTTRDNAQPSKFDSHQIEFRYNF